VKGQQGRPSIFILLGDSPKRRKKITKGSQPPGKGTTRTISETGCPNWKIPGEELVEGRYSSIRVKARTFLGRVSKSRTGDENNQGIPAWQRPQENTPGTFIKGGVVWHPTQENGKAQITLEPCLQQGPPSLVGDVGKKKNRWGSVPQRSNSNKSRIHGEAVSIDHPCGTVQSWGTGKQRARRGHEDENHHPT